MTKPTIHLICSAHLDPVWQWRWEEGCAEALSTFGNAVQLLHEDDKLIFNHNEAVLYRWVQRYDPALFRQIQKLATRGRWCISGGWYLQPDVNIPGTESIIRQILEGRKFFREHFGSEPKVAYNFDSFGHSGGLPQILKRAGYKMYIHMRPQHPDLKLPSDLYRWRGVDGSEILTYRIDVGLYHTEHDNIVQKLQEGTELALKLNRDVPVFWGIGNHGGGATREALGMIDDFVQKEDRVRIVHSTTDGLYEALKKHAKSSPVVEGDLQRVFTGCYTSLSRLKRRAQRSLGELVQTESVCTWAWWERKAKYPAVELDQAWRDHLFNDFHDILPGSCVEPAEQDALDQYGKVSESIRRLRLLAVSGFNKGKARKLYVPVTVVNTSPSCTTVPVEVECMIDLRPKWTGDWHMRLYSLDGKEIACQEEQPESLLPFNWRKKISFMADLPEVGIGHYEVRVHEGKKEVVEAQSAIRHSLDLERGLINSLDAGEGRECVAGHLLQPIVVDDDGDSWGADRWSYRNVVGQFELQPKRVCVLSNGPIRKISESVLLYGNSKIVLRTIAYANWPVLEFQLRIHWAEVRRRLKLSMPTVFKDDRVLCEVPGGAIYRPADGQEHVQGRWCFLEGAITGRHTGFAVINSGQHGFDFQDGEIRLSVLRSAAYCHDQGLQLGERPIRKYMDQGVHDVRVLVTAGEADTVRASLTGLADWVSAPPVVYSHLPIGEKSEPRLEFLSLKPQNIRLLACKQSEDGKALVLRLHETTGAASTTRLGLEKPNVNAKLSFKPFELKTIRVEKSGRWREVAMIEEQ
ncbi:MAG: glycoside hydrolase family 38 C-terminal domain-containing protein [Bacteroidota bacterium]